MLGFKCAECGEVLSENEIAKWAEPHGEIMSGCPCCGGTVEEIYACDLCNEAEAADGYNLCEECLFTLRQDFKRLINKHFSSAQVKAITEMYERGELFDEENK